MDSELQSSSMRIWNMSLTNSILDDLNKANSIRFKLKFFNKNFGRVIKNFCRTNSILVKQLTFHTFSFDFGSNVPLCNYEY